MCIRKLSNTVLQQVQVFDDSLVCNSEDNFSSFFSAPDSCIFHCKTFLNCCVCCSSKGEGRGQMSLVRVLRGTWRPHTGSDFARIWKRTTLSWICVISNNCLWSQYHFEQNWILSTSLPTVRLPTWLNKWSLQAPHGRRPRPCPLPGCPSPKRIPSSSQCYTATRRRVVQSTESS